MSYLSDLLKNGTALQSKAGSGAINANDLLAIANNQLWPCSVTNYAAVANQGSATIPSTTVSSYSVTGSQRNCMFLSPADASIFIAQASVTPNNTLRVSKYLSDGSLFGSLVLDPGGGTAITPTIAQLSNGNYVVTWGSGTGLFFAIFDQFLNSVTPKTSAGTTDATNTGICSMIALSGGGFAIAYSNSNPYLAVFDNSGNTVRLGAALNNAAAFAAVVNVTLAQLSNGNIAIAIATGIAAKLLGYSITTAAGVNVQQCTMLDTTNTAFSFNAIQISVLASGYFCVAAMYNTHTSAYVLSNAGAVQGAGYIDSNGATGSSGRLVSDGTNFWLLAPASSSALNAIYLPITGTGYVVTSLAMNQTGSGLDAFYDRGFIVAAGGSNNVYVLTMSTSGVATIWQSFTAPAGAGSACIRPAGDFSYISQNASVFVGVKYLNASIAGVSQQTLAAGNAGTPISFSMGPGGYPCNALLGTVGKSFDHSAANIIANKGVMLSNAVSLKGI